MRDVLYTDDMEFFLNRTNPDLTADEIQQIMDTVRLAGSESDFATLHKVYDWMVNGIQFTPQAALPRMVNLIEFEDPEKNVFRAVNQFTVEYTNNGQTQTRRPDILLFVNGMPLCIIELKNPADKKRDDLRCMGTDQYPLLARYSASAALLPAGLHFRRCENAARHCPRTL